jgi:hypothetical protein
MIELNFKKKSSFLQYIWLQKYETFGLKNKRGHLNCNDQKRLMFFELFTLCEMNPGGWIVDE